MNQSLKPSASLFLVLAICCFSFHSLVAQNKYNVESTPIADVRQNKYQIDFGFGSFRSIITNTAGASILFKKKYNKGDLIEVNNLRFLRGFFTLNSQINFSEDPSENETLDSTYIRTTSNNFVDFSLGIGFEKQFQNNKLVHYFGVDFFGSYSDRLNSNLFYSNSISITSSSRFSQTRTIKGGAIPFFGIKYYITDQLNIGIETGLTLNYFNTKITERIRSVVSNFDINTGYENFTTFHYTEDPLISNGIQAQFLGVRFITVGYTFK